MSDRNHIELDDNALKILQDERTRLKASGIKGASYNEAIRSLSRDRDEFKRELRILSEKLREM